MHSFMQTELHDKFMGTVLITKKFQNMFRYADINLTLYIKYFCCCVRQQLYLPVVANSIKI
jgi:hypothetical protein